MQVAMLARPSAFGADDVPIAPPNTASATKIVQACAVSPQTAPAKTAIEIFKLIPSAAEQNALALTAINYGANATCVAASLAQARQAQGTAPTDPGVPQPQPKGPGAPAGAGGGVAIKVALVVGAVAAAGAAGFAIAHYRGKR